MEYSAAVGRSAVLAHAACGWTLQTLYPGKSARHRRTAIYDFSYMRYLESAIL